jgi:RND family efflux transporter MFP subunit
VRKILKFVTPMVVLAAGIGSVMALGAAKETPEKKIEEPRVLSLHVESVRAEQVRLSVRTQGEVSPKTDIVLIPQVSGRIVAVSDHFAEGGAFVPGETLIKIDDADYLLALTRAEARVAEAAVTLEKEMADASIKRKQWNEWVKDGEPTPLALNAPQVARAQANLRAAEADMKSAKLNLERTKISVPFKGRVRERLIGVGQYVSAGTQLGRVFATDKVEIRLPLTDTQLMELNLPIGFVATNHEDHEVSLTANMGGKTHKWLGHIVRVNAAVDQQTRLVYAIAEVEDPYGVAADNGMPLAVGLFVNASIRSAVTQSALVMPRDALRGKDKVYVISGDKLEIRTVSVLSTSADQLIVSAGVAADEQVVTSAVRSAYDGMAVRAITRTASKPVTQNSDSASR